MTEVGYKKAQSDNLPMIDSLMVAGFLKNSDCFVAAEMRGVKASRASRECYGDQAVGYVQVKHADGKCTVKGKLCPEHKVRAKQYSMELVVDEISHKVDKVECQDCPASSGGCKHAIAFLMWVHRRSEEKATTEVKCYWKRSELASVGSSRKFVSSSELGRTRKKESDVVTNDNSFLDEVISQGKKLKVDNQLLRYFQSESYDVNSLSLHGLMQRFRERGGICCKTFIAFARENMPQRLINEAAASTINQGENPLWHELRYMRITASKVHEAAHCGTSDGTLVERVVGAIKIKPTKAMRRGCYLEAQVIKTMEKKLGVRLMKTGLMLSNEVPIMGASPDAVGPDFILEVKCPTKVDTIKHYIKDNKPINKYMAQMQLQMYFSRKKRAVFCIAAPDFEKTKDVSCLWIEYDNDFVMNVVAAATRFWEENIFPILFNSCESGWLF